MRAERRRLMLSESEQRLHLAARLTPRRPGEYKVGARNTDRALRRPSEIGPVFGHPHLHRKRTRIALFQSP